MDPFYFGYYDWFDLMKLPCISINKTEKVKRPAKNKKPITNNDAKQRIYRKQGR